jgi:hypothetical protein
VRIPRRDERRRPPADFVAAEEADRLAAEALTQLGHSFREDSAQPGNQIDLAILTLCRLRRAAAGQKGGPEHGDDAVRAVLEQAGSEALIAITSRSISYMDETGFGRPVAPWRPRDDRS